MKAKILGLLALSFFFIHCDKRIVMINRFNEVKIETKNYLHKGDSTDFSLQICFPVKYFIKSSHLIIIPTINDSIKIILDTISIYNDKFKSTSLKINYQKGGCVEKEYHNTPTNDFNFIDLEVFFYYGNVTEQLFYTTNKKIKLK